MTRRWRAFWGSEGAWWFSAGVSTPALAYNLLHGLWLYACCSALACACTVVGVRMARREVALRALLEVR